MSSSQNKPLWPAVLLLVGILGFWLGWRQWEPLLANRKPLPTMATASFSDGVRLEVYDVTLGIETGFSRRTRPHWLPWVSSSASQSYHGGGMVFKTRGKDGQFASIDVSNQRQTPMLGMVFRLIGKDRLPLSTDRYHSQGELLHIIRSGSLFERMDNYNDIQPHEGRLDWSVEVEDGRGGWMLMAGPIVVHSEDGRAIALSHAYPSDRQNLRVRVSRKTASGRESVEVSVPTPGFKSSVAALSPEPLPATRKVGDYEVTLSDFSLAGGKFLLPKLEAKHPFARPDDVDISTHFEDRFGNVIPHLSGMMPLPGEDVLRIVGEVNRSAETFPYLESEVEVFAEGIWSADASKRQIKLTETAKARGIRSITLTPGSGSKEGRRQLPRQLEIQVQGGMTETEWKAWERDMNRYAICVFPDGSARSQGESQHAGSNWGTNGGKVGFNLNAGWNGDIEEGTPIRIGCPRKIPPVPFSFQAALKRAK